MKAPEWLVGEDVYGPEPILEPISQLERAQLNIIVLLSIIDSWLAVYRVVQWTLT